MRCPHCHNNKSAVSDTRDSYKRCIIAVTRTRTCTRCGHRWYTREVEWNEKTITGRQVEAVQKRMDALLQQARELSNIIQNSEPIQGRKRVKQPSNNH